MRARSLGLRALLLLLTAACFAAGGGPVPRILIVGDSWAACIATQSVGAPGFGSFDAVLKEEGFGQYCTQGANTAWGGRKASDWVKPENRKRIVKDLAAHPTIGFVHLIIGGNDFLSTVAFGKGVATLSAKERSARWDAIEADIQAIVDLCLAQRPGIRVLMSGYDYLDPAKAEAAPYGMDFAGATPRQLNDAFVELGRRKLHIAQSTDRCEYVSNWGLLQYHYAYPSAGLPKPGPAPDYAPFAGGDPEYGMPPKASAGDGIHPVDEAHRHMLRNCFEQFYRAWLSEERSCSKSE